MKIHTAQKLIANTEIHKCTIYTTVTAPATWGSGSNAVAIRLKDQEGQYIYLTDLNAQDFHCVSDCKEKE